MNAQVKTGGLKALGMKALNSVLPRMEWLKRVGLSFGGRRDLYAVFGYKPSLSFDDFYQKFQRQDIARRIMKAPVSGVWSDPPIITADEAFMTNWQMLVAEQQVFWRLQQLDILCGLGKYAIMVVGMDDGQPLSTPIDPGRQRKVIYLQPYGESRAKITKYEESSSNPRFGKPTMYEVTPGDINNASQIGISQVMQRNKFTVHYSRVLHIAEETLENETFGHPRMEPVYNLLDDLLKVAGGSAETYWLVGNRGMQIDVDKEMDLSPDDADNLADEIEEYQHELRRTIRTRGVKITNLGSDTPDPRGTFDIIMSLLSATTGIPKRVMMGSEAGQLASQQDRANWSQRLSERISEFAQPVVLLPFINMLVNAGVVPKPTGLIIDWPDTFKLNPLERGQTSAQMARSMANVSKALTTFETSTNAEFKAPFSVDEVRSIVGFSKHAPVFDDKKNQKQDPNATPPPNNG